jgi:large subunit ribosomal protein L10
MALKKAQKDEVVAEVSDLLNTSKMTVVAKYQGTTVKALQTLRREARANGTKVKVVKNRLVIKAVQANDTLKDADTSSLQGMLLYAFNANDEVAPAQTLSQFAKQNPTIEFVGALTGEGKFIGSEDVKALATCQARTLMIAQVLQHCCLRSTTLPTPYLATCTPCLTV